MHPGPLLHVSRNIRTVLYPLAASSAKSARTRPASYSSTPNTRSSNPPSTGTIQK